MKTILSRAVLALTLATSLAPAFAAGGLVNDHARLSLVRSLSPTDRVARDGDIRTYWLAPDGGNPSR